MPSDHPLLKRRTARFAIPGLHRRTQSAGGSTTSATTAKEYDPERGGFAVGIEQNTAKRVHGQKVAGHKRAQHSLLRRYPQLKEEGHYVGTWKDDKGRTHYDPAEVVADEKEARRKAKERKQEAIWDFKNKREIRL